MKPEEVAEQLSRETAGFVFMAVDENGMAIGQAKEAALTLSLLAAQNQANILPKELLSSIKVIETLTRGEAKSGRGRKAARAKKRWNSWNTATLRRSIYTTLLLNSPPLNSVSSLIILVKNTWRSSGDTLVRRSWHLCSPSSSHGRQKRW